MKLRKVIAIGLLGVAGACGSGDSSPTAPQDGAPAPLVLSPGSLPAAFRGLPYEHALGATGGEGPYTWSIVGGALPEGLSLSQGGVLSGVPPSSERSEITVGLSSADGQTASAAMNMVVRLQPADRCADHGPDAWPSFEDPVVESEVLTLAQQCSGIGQVTFLWLMAGGVRSLVGMQNLTGLKYLHFSTLLVGSIPHSFTDVSPLADLASLEELHLVNDAVEDLGPLHELTGLRAFTAISRAASPGVVDLSPIASWVALQALDLRSNRVEDLGPLAGLSRLNRLLLSGNAISDLAPLAGLTEIDTLSLAFNALTDVTPLSGLTELDHLDLSGNPDLVDIQPLLDNPGIGPGDWIVLTSTGVACSALDALRDRGANVIGDECVFLPPNVACVEWRPDDIATFEDPLLAQAIVAALGVNAAEDLTCGRLATLTELSAASLGISNLVGIHNLPNLTRLDLTANALVDPSELGALDLLEELYLASNEVEGIIWASNLKELRSLDVGQNALWQIGVSLDLPHLTHLDLADNLLLSTSGLAALPSIESIDLDGNEGLWFAGGLLDNPGLAAGDTASLRGTSIDCADVDALKARGVTVLSDCG